MLVIGNEVGTGRPDALMDYVEVSVCSTQAEREVAYLFEVHDHNREASRQC